MRVNAPRILDAIDALKPDSLPLLFSKKDRAHSMVRGWGEAELGEACCSLLKPWIKSDSWRGRNSSIPSLAIVLSSSIKPPLHPMGATPKNEYEWMADMACLPERLSVVAKHVTSDSMERSSHSSPG